MKKVLLILIAIVVLAAGWFFVSPLFIDRSVDEDFDFVTADGALDLDRVMAMPDDKRKSMQEEIMATASAAADRAEDEAMPEAQTSVLGIGRFVDADAVHKGSGTATLYALADGRKLVRFEDFRTTNGPALVVYLAEHPSPKNAGDVLDGGYLSLGKLKGNVGNQNYLVPDGVDVDDYNSVVIWCELFDVLFSPAALQRSPISMGNDST